MNEFVPGPWEVHKKNALLIRPVGYEGASVCVLTDFPLCQLPTAHLIAASPDLFEALKEMVESYEYEASMDNPALLRARAAIAKVNAWKESSIR
jgi:hypothetical protein